MRYLSTYKALVGLVVGAGFTGGFALLIDEALRGAFHFHYVLIALGFLPLGARFHSFLRRTYRVSFDDRYLYVQQKGQELAIPLSHIRQVDIKTLGGVYEVTMIQREPAGDRFFFKPSLLYPFNFKAKDRLVDQLRGYIEAARQQPDKVVPNALHS